MAFVVGSAPRVRPAWRASPPVRQYRKIALLGSHSETLQHVPWFDPTWELWGHASSAGYYKRVLDRYFEMHARSRWDSVIKQKGRYSEWLRNTTVPIYMHEHYPELPSSVRYPKERILMEYGGIRRYFKNTMAWMTALAFAEGVTTLALFGINYSHDSEYRLQRGSAEYWLGRAEERGIQVMLPDECSLLAEPKGLYGYESHDENGVLTGAYRPKPLEDVPHPVMNKPAVPPAHLAEEIAADELTRPEWAKLWMKGEQPPVTKGNGDAHGGDYPARA